MRKVASCSECPMYRDGEDGSMLIGQALIFVQDVCGMNGRDITVYDAEEPTDPPPKWCPLREGDAVVSLERADA